MTYVGITYPRHAPVLAIALLTSVLLAQPIRHDHPQPLPQSVGVVVQRVEYGRGTGAITVTFRNTGKLEVTAFGWSLATKRAGTVDLFHQETVDLLLLLCLRAANSQTAPAGAPAPSFRANETYSLSWVPPTTWGDLSAAQIIGEVNTMVIFEDSTAVGDGLAIERIFADRQADATMEMDAVRQMKAMPRDEGGGARLRALRDQLAGAGGTGGDSTIRREVKAGAALQAVAYTTGKARLVHQAVSLYERSGWTAVDGFLNVLQLRAEAMARQSTRRDR